VICEKHRCSVAELWLEPSKLRVRPAPISLLKKRYIQQDLQSPDGTIRVGLPSFFSLIISDQNFVSLGIKSDVATDTNVK
jgi:hypothetical protein